MQSKKVMDSTINDDLFKQMVSDNLQAYYDEKQQILLSKAPQWKYIIEHEVYLKQQIPSIDDCTILNDGKRLYRVCTPDGLYLLYNKISKSFYDVTLTEQESEEAFKSEDSN